MTKGIVFDIKECSVHDGPGVRTTVFLKGCPLRCVWCHNPEGLSIKPQLMYKKNKCVNCQNCKRPCNHEECKVFDRCIHACPVGCLSISGKEYTPESLCEEVLKNKTFFDSTGGGITFSGGEPLMQSAFLLECLDLLSCTGRAIETSGYAEHEVFKSVVDRCDYVIMDIKIADDETHKKYTGVSNKQIIENAKFLQSSGKEHVFRTPLIPGITDTDENLSAIEKLVGSSPWEKLQYNALAGAKYEMLGMEYPYESIKI